ncbi:SusD/RagB family nutrient-binding outer membrane lipoprotein [Sediminibacterium soli]|uniref:SusD/RagB family nutrient-binding outer membrane lipoprotein n=1 Tax=Sediminibacterium soli TaxID=2698829 RepID=UPI001379ECD6|nr:SusD/RagB family nutrient-binding outer membrane lipoprotein [Sediminibacterium soli]NCI46284.1 SusD/RagB family nutrient-binding outer membrane lipoprotein [Sediminibacterium soli]
MKKILLSTLLIGSVMTGCVKSFDDLKKDTNRPVNVPPSLVLSSVLNDFTQPAWSLPHRWNQYSNCNYNYYGNQEYNWTNVSFNPYNTLKNIGKMEQEAIAGGAAAQNPYSALGKFFRAFFYYDLSMRVGDLPLSEAVQGLNVATPKYDTQKDVFVQVLKWLDDANTDLAQLITKGTNTLTGDYYYNNDLRKWQKAINAFKLRVLISLSRKEADTDLAVKTRFAAVIADPDKYPLFGGMGENLQYVYNSTFNKYPTNPDNFGFDATRYNTAATYLNNLVALQDPRTFVTAEPAAKRVAAGAAPTSFAAFLGASSGEDLADMSTKAGNGEYSFINRKRYYSTYTAEANIQIGYAEMCFNIAEAVNRGWISGNAESWYRKGIDASIGFYGIVNGNNTVYFQKPGGTLNDYNSYVISYDADAYYNQSAVKYNGNNATGLSQIVLQKYLAFFQNSGWEAYYNWRRTGVPGFLTGPGTGNSQRVAKRFLYPTSELATNNANLKTALQRQFSNGVDDINADLWINK